jgi:hypothetical protein
MFLFEISLTIIFLAVSLTYSIPWPEHKFHEIHGPEQVHISYGDTPSEMIVVWSTGNISPNSTSFVTYGLNSDKLDMVVKANDAVLTEGNPNGLDQIHRAVMTVRVLRCFEFLCIYYKPYKCIEYSIGMAIHCHCLCLKS